MLVSVTRLRVRRRRFLPAFLVLAYRAARQARAAPGNLAVELLADAWRTFWTLTIWVDAGAMHAFMRAQPHRQAMNRLGRWCSEASVVHWEQQTAAPPSWGEAYKRMQSEGRPSPIEHPTAAHGRFEIAAPRRRGVRTRVRLK